MKIYIGAIVLLSAPAINAMPAIRNETIDSQLVSSIDKSSDSIGFGDIVRAGEAMLGDHAQDLKQVYLPNTAPSQDAITTCRVHDFTNATYKWIISDIAYLKHLAHPWPCRVPPGPGKCARVACTRESGIFVCNYKETEIVPSCLSVADLAQGILDVCAQGLPLESGIQGMKWHEEGWFVTVGIAQHGCRRCESVITLPPWNN